MRRLSAPGKAADWAVKGPAAETLQLTNGEPSMDPGGFFAVAEELPKGSKLGATREVPKAAGETRVKVPIDPTNEIVIISAALVSAEERTRLLAMFGPDDFHAKYHPEIWTALGELERQHLAYDPATLRVLSAGAIDVDYVELLTTQRPEVPPNLSRHVEGLRFDNAKIATARGPMRGLLEAMADPSSNPEKLRILAEQVSAGFSQATTTGLVRDPTQLLRETEAELDDRAKGIAVYPYGIDGLDYARETGQPIVIPGAAPKKLTLLVGVSSSGKTSTTMEVVIGQVLKNRRVLLGAWENGSLDTLNMLAARYLRISRTRERLGDLNPQERKDLRDCKEWLLEHVFFFEHPAATNRSAFRASIERAATKRNLHDRSLANDISLAMVERQINETGADFFIGDLWKRVLRTSSPDEEEQVLYATQDLAKRSGAHLFLVHQLNLKDVEREADKRPRRDLIKGNGVWVEVADTIIAPYRPAQFKAVADNVIQYFLLKQRFGRAPVVIECEYDPDTGCVSNGKEVAYRPVGEIDSINDFLGASPTAPKFGAKKKRA